MFLLLDIYNLFLCICGLAVWLVDFVLFALGVGNKIGL
jgi:hypothetical protein